VKKHLVLVCLLLIVAVPTWGVEDGSALYVGGTVANLKEGTQGRIDMSSLTEMAFESSGNRLAIPYAKIEAYEYSQPVAHHLGVLPAIGVGLLKKRQRKHFVQISYRDEVNTPQVAIFEVSKKMPRTMLAILQLRAPQGCKPKMYANCRLAN
jgi:hypothetical protein